MWEPNWICMTTIALIRKTDTVTTDAKTQIFLNRSRLTNSDKLTDIGVMERPQLLLARSTSYILILTGNSQRNCETKKRIHDDLEKPLYCNKIGNLVTRRWATANSLIGRYREPLMHSISRMFVDLDALYSLGKHKSHATMTYNRTCRIPLCNNIIPCDLIGWPVTQWMHLFPYPFFLQHYLGHRIFNSTTFWSIISFVSIPHNPLVLVSLYPQTSLSPYPLESDGRGIRYSIV